MKQLSETLNDVFILEAFQSTILRELVSDLKASGKWKKQGMEILPHGIAWDKIPDDDIFEGETGNQAFYDTFIKSKKFLVIWFNHLTRQTRADSRSRRSSGWYVRPGYTYITIGNQFVEYDFRKQTWDTRFEAKNDRLVPVRARTDNDDEYRRRVEKHMANQDASKFADIGAEDKRYKPSPSKGLGPADGHCTVEELASKCICSCIAISLEDVAKYSTVELMKKRYEQKLNATAMMKKKINWADRWSKNNPGKYIYSLPSDVRSKNNELGDRISIVDYPDISRYNKQRYNQALMTAKSTSILKKYANDVEEFQKVIDDNNEMTHVTPLAISSIDAGKFADIYFNRKLSYSKAKADALAALTNHVREIVFLIEEIILIINKTKGPDYRYGKSEEELIRDSVNTRINRIESIIPLAKSQCKIIAHSI